jgi:hypothetical protein
MVIGGWNDMSLDELVGQIKNINFFLKYCKKKLRYEIISGKKQVVAGMNYEIILKYNSRIYKEPLFYKITYFINLSGEINGTVHFNKLCNQICVPSVCFIDYKYKC